MGPSMEIYLLAVKRNNTGVFTAAIRPAPLKKRSNQISSQLQNLGYGRNDENRFATPTYA